ncbi:hypothetical protein ACFXPX_18335 [Kitasatospora sp. NPDC059146]|uniref:hypothetical protein n=1 Tax=Kitasatospora sp. NPDC059146 TaxID=3346741 RepID=UPI0036B4FD57
MAVIVLVMQTTASFWDSLVFDGIDDLDVEAVTALFGTVEVVARGRGAGVPGCRGAGVPGRSVRTVAASRTRCTTDIAAD